MTKTITGSDMSYERALEIIQTEEYLTAADVDLIAKKKRRKKKRSITFTKVRCSNGFNVFNKVNCPRFDFDLSNIFPFSLLFRGPIRGPFGRPSAPTRRPRFRFRPPPPIGKLHTYGNYFTSPTFCSVSKNLMFEKCEFCQK